ncbi:DUF4350 domain-containing protein [Leadbettera azotonutricia]|uniref:DUF4350 domain-containing protein n=1 Tax=Leadbettera azotonutricia (strain ATCC BAA-888 / DSM 13862 / ZAS-9) TaxID=545695 RepID=F5YE26_LEAAZ|nr:DUF4350 domain-containing protein [Leadbettera azotonutricia]AEF80915.1 hypothetical protein TREAZ_1527 [Leadbettera azotonutricia ZAS-9]
MRKYLLFFGIGIAVLGIIGFVCWSLFEIVPNEEYFPPVREARINKYLALDRWLNQTGHTVRIADSGDFETLKKSGEGTIFIQNSLFNWTEDAAAYLAEWIEQGGNLVLSLGYSWEWGDDEALGGLLRSFGIEEGEEPEDWEYHYDPDQPSFGMEVVFLASDDPESLAFMSSDGLVRIVQQKKGMGKFTVMGRPLFMTSDELLTEQNARLSWYLLADSGDPGVFFIRGRERAKGLIGRLFQRGNFSALIISALALIIIGLWTVIPVFGIAARSEEKPGRPLGERFLAEGRFLKRFGALESYRAAYIKEIKGKLLRKENIKTESGIILRAIELWKEASGGGDYKDVEKAMSSSRQKNKEFPRMIAILKTILERI